MRTFSLLLAAVLAGHAGTARADETPGPDRIVIASDGAALPPESELELRRALRSRLGDQLERHTLHIAVRGDQAEILLDATVRQVPLGGRRGPAAVRLLVIFVADLITPAPSLAEPSEPEIEEPPPPLAPVIDAPLPPPPPDSDESALWLGAAPVFSHFVSARGGASAGVLVWGEVRRAHVAAGFSIGWNHALARGDDRSEYATFDLFPATVRAAAHLHGLEIGARAFIAPFQFSRVASNTGLAMGVGAQLGYRHGIGERLELVLELGSDLFARRTRLRIDDRTVYTMPMVTAYGAAGLAWRL